MATEIIVAFLSGILLICLILISKWWWSRRWFPSVLVSIHEVYHTLNTILKESTAHRVTVSRAENGGSAPTAGKDIYTTVVYEVFDKELGPIKPFWQKQPLNEPYIQVLTQIAEEGHITVRPSQMASKDTETEGVIRCYKIKAKKGQLYYLSVYFKEDDPCGHNLRNLIQHSLKELASLID